MVTQLQNYYANLGEAFEGFYRKPEWQEDLGRFRCDMPPLFSGHHVLEVACGTGYWMELISSEAESVTGADVNETNLEIARQKRLGPGCTVDFDCRDAFDINAVDGVLTACFAAL